MALKNLTEEQVDDRLTYLLDVASGDLGGELARMEIDHPGNPAKVIETLDGIARYARELAKYFRETEQGR